MNLLLSHTLQVHRLPAREGVGRARRSWHQPVIPPLLLPPSVSLLNQIISLTRARATPLLSQLLCASFCSFGPSSPTASQSCVLHNTLAADGPGETREKDLCHQWPGLLFNLPPLSGFLPVCACPRSKCAHALGTWNGIWCHITRRTRIQKSSQHGELTWTAAKAAATHQLSATAPVKCPFGCMPTRITVSRTHAHARTHWHFQPPAALSGDKETEGSCLAQLLPAPNTYWSVAGVMEEAALDLGTLSACLLAL